ncbi:MAG: hypothetical protein COW04_02010 [Deltaproteobacteria bacterium CG12_big_fil_rev_8_21_14_0_65_43_10]|nr:MAG: hypothetical protein COW04_02010 [Deltaproteobacteria bacterium CG12_big_fil_rev_8_21_14_0_65_43_10]PIU85259.1 MAG: hypothetical protein COS67_08760 [Deltaproteobacteria bacterium CG06_land_8_20_14_3_00_44_19]
MKAKPLNSRKIAVQCRISFEPLWLSPTQQGGTLVIGVSDRAKAVVGVRDPLSEEERITSIFADSIRPTLIPEIQIVSWRDRELIIVRIPHLVGPYYIRLEGPEEGVYIRLGSTNRRAGPELIAAIQRIAINTFFDEQPCMEANSEAIDFRAASEFFLQVGRTLAPSARRSLGLLVDHAGQVFPSRGAVLLFGKNRRLIFPDTVIRCARFRGVTTTQFIDQTEIDEHLPRSVESAIAFIERHTLHGAEIGHIRRKDIHEYPPPAIREALLNAVVHADYSIGGMNIKVAIFDDRIEITNPGMLPFGITIEAAISGVSKLRNRVIGRVFRELKLIEQWGSGIGRMIAVCNEAGLQQPRFEEIGNSFKVNLFNRHVGAPVKVDLAWQRHLEKFLHEHNEISTLNAARIWKVSDRAARTRLQKLVAKGFLAEIGTGPKDPRKVYVLKRNVFSGD